ncbi:MAG: hypothetical protein A4E28_02920 [Methanocella sp. PtaU1.Bin125]|nr:MAG: hypothetical protein A4E28_02920 [Methanocella sp. PtaU1.Bin125]
MGGLGGLLNRDGYVLLAVALLSCGSGIGLNAAYPGPGPVALAAVVFGSAFLLSMAALAVFMTS